MLTTFSGKSSFKSNDKSWRNKISETPLGGMTGIGIHITDQIGNISEFDQTDLEPEIKQDWKAPYVKGAKIQIGCSYVNEYLIKENDTVLVVGKIEHLYIEDDLLGEDGWVQLDKGDIVTINGLDGYAIPNLIKRFEYAKPKR